MGIYKDVMGTLVRVLAADNIDNSTKQSWQKLIDADLRQGGTDSSISVRDKFDYDCCLHALLHSHLAPVQWDVLVAKYSTHKANKVAAIGRLISRIQSPAPQLFIYKALTAWAIPKLKGVQVAPRSGREVVSRGLREDLEHAAIGKEVAACRVMFTRSRESQAVCGEIECAIAYGKSEKGRAIAGKALAEVGRRQIKVRKEKLKSRADYLKDTQQAFNAWVRARDAALRCVSCGRHHQGKYEAGHYRTVGSNPALRFEPMNCHRQCSPCNTRLSGNIVNYRIELVKRIGAEAVEWLEGPHEAKKYTVDELKAMTADYRAKTKELKKGLAA